MSRLTDLLQQLKSSQPEFARDLEREVEALQNRRAFGLNFERHIPEAVNLPGRPIRKGDKVRVLPPRGDMRAPDKRVWIVQSMDKVANTAELLERQLVTSEAAPPELRSAPLNDLVAVGDFSDPIYPGLVETGRVELGGDKPFHTVINAENYHALQALLLTHRGKVDCIYIDPPYNTGAKDWKYNNDYVEADDHYRHSRWLAMMERRLLLAKELLNPADSVLIVTIDEKEYLRLGLLLEQTFPDGRIQMVTIVINPSGAGGDGFNRVEEYAFFVLFGDATLSGWTDNLLTDEDAPNSRIRGGLSWESFLRSGRTWYRTERPNLCYPVFIDPGSLKIVGAGEPFAGDDESDRPTREGGLDLAWPVRSDGRLGIWRKNAEGLMDLVAKGFAHVGGRDQRRDTYSIKYLLGGTISLIESGDVEISGSGDRGQVVVSETRTIDKTGKTVWNRPSHNAGKHGSDLIKLLVPNASFDFPKSLYAVEDAVRFAVRAKPSAVVLDFFAGSGTTSHAVMRINREDGGVRTSILITNNEVAAVEHRALAQKNLRPGDLAWERLGICEQITKPRVRAAICGTTADGEPIEGDYKFTNEFPMADGFEENAVFYTLTYESPLAVTQHRAFERVAPLLWLRAGAQGRRIDTIPTSGWDVAERYGVIDDLGAAGAFVEALAATPTATQAFIVTDDDSLFRDVARQLPKGCEPVQLYRAYLDIFENDAMRGTK
jgi:adenine-specific DNA-methyltransferase